MLLLWWGLALSTAAHAGDSFECSLHPRVFDSRYEEFPPHTKVNSDLNNDEIPDYFYLAGASGDHVTCVFFGQKDGNKSALRLEYRDRKFYVPIMDIIGNGRPQFLLPQPVPSCLPELSRDSGTRLIDSKFLPEINALMAKWSKGYEAFLYKYTSKEGGSIRNLYLLHPAHIFLYDGARKTDVTENAIEYLNLKKRVMQDVIDHKKLSKECRQTMKYNLKRIEQYHEKPWEPVSKEDPKPAAPQPYTPPPPETFPAKGGQPNAVQPEPTPAPAPSPAPAPEQPAEPQPAPPPGQPNQIIPPGQPNQIPKGG